MFNLAASLKKLELQIKKVVQAIIINETNNSSLKEEVLARKDVVRNKKVVKSRIKQKDNLSKKVEILPKVFNEAEMQARLISNDSFFLPSILNGLNFKCNDAASANAIKQNTNYEIAELNHYKIRSTVQPLPKGLITIVNIYSKTS